MFYDVSIQYIEHLLLKIKGGKPNLIGEIVVADPLLPRGSVLDKEVVAQLLPP